MALSRTIEVNQMLLIELIAVMLSLLSVPHVGSEVVRIDLLRFLAGCRKKRLNQALSVLSLSLGFL